MERRKQKLTQAELLKLANFEVTKEVLTNIKLFEAGELDITFDIFHALARALGKNVMISVEEHSTLRKPAFYLEASDSDNRN